MQLITRVFLASATLASIASAHAGHHDHAHFHKKQARDTDTVIVNDVAVKYVFDGQEVSYAQVCQGLANGTFVWDDSVSDRPDCSVNAPPPAVVSSATSAKATKIPSAAAFLAISASSTSSSSSSSAAATSSAVPVPVQGSANTNLGFSKLLVNNPGVNQNFPDGELPCTFDSLQQYGAVPVDWAGYGGFSGIQSANLVGSVVSNLVTVKGGSTADGFYSYACPMGLLKSQYPEVTSSTTLGGVQCKNGKFYLTNPSTKKLCIPGAGVVTLVNNVNQVISACRTDYPGTEAETVPAAVYPGGTAPVAIVDGDTYFQWTDPSGKPLRTSGQYYLNPAGYDVDQACDWFTDQTHSGIARGNWAPLTLGLGMTDGTVWVGLLSTEQVLPDTGGVIVQPNYSVKITGGGGQTCEFKGGKFYLNGNYEGTLGQFLANPVAGVPGVTCAFPEGSDITATFY